MCTLRTASRSYHLQARESSQLSALSALQVSCSTLVKLEHKHGATQTTQLTTQASTVNSLHGCYASGLYQAHSARHDVTLTTQPSLLKGDMHEPAAQRNTAQLSTVVKRKESTSNGAASVLKTSATQPLCQLLSDKPSFCCSAAFIPQLATQEGKLSVVQLLLSLSHPEPVSTGQYDHAKCTLSALQAEGPTPRVIELLVVWHQRHIVTVVCGSITGTGRVSVLRAQY